MLIWDTITTNLNYLRYKLVNQHCIFIDSSCLLSSLLFNRIHRYFRCDAVVLRRKKIKTWGEYWIRQFFLFIPFATRRMKKNTAIILILLRLNVMHFFSSKVFFMTFHPKRKRRKKNGKLSLLPPLWLSFYLSLLQIKFE